MSSIPVIQQNIVPVSPYTEKANCLVITSSSGLPPVFQVALGIFTPGSPEVASPGDGITPGKPAVPDRFVTIRQFQVTMTESEWNNWKDQKDEDYIKSIVLSRLGYTAA